MNPLQTRRVPPQDATTSRPSSALFTVSMFWRGIIPFPLSDLSRAPTDVAQRSANWLASKSILNQSYALDLRELEQGDPEIAGEAARLMLTGSRGFAVAYLWHSAIEAQKRNDFHKMEKRIQAVTSLQPHFITPWLFQSWNIAYNVSVEMQGSGDMYFYIARGIELLGRGRAAQQPYRQRSASGDANRLARHPLPDRVLLPEQVRRVRPGGGPAVPVPVIVHAQDRTEPGRLTDPVTKVSISEAFQKFCEKYPHLVRRLRGEDRKAEGVDARTRQQIREALKCPTPESIVQFLRDNRDVPGRYKYVPANSTTPTSSSHPCRRSSPKGRARRRTPDRPPTTTSPRTRRLARGTPIRCVPLPPNPPDWEGKPMPWRTPRPTNTTSSSTAYRAQPLLIIFRQGAPRVPDAIRPRWSRRKAGSTPKGGRSTTRTTSRSRTGGSRTLRQARRAAASSAGRRGARPASSLDAWTKARDLWKHHSDEYGLDLSPERLGRYRARARLAMAGASRPM